MRPTLIAAGSKCGGVGSAATSSGRQGGGTANGGSGYIAITIIRKSATTQGTVAFGLLSSSTVMSADGTKTLTGDVDLVVAGLSGVAAGDSIFHSMVVEALN